MKIIPNNLREIKTRERMQKLANITECECSDNMNEMENPYVAGAATAAIPAGLIGLALKAVVQKYKEAKKQGLGNKEAVIQALSGAGSEVQNAKDTK